MPKGAILEKEIKKTNDMTIGNPIKLIISFAIPLFIGNVFQQIYNIADTMIIGHKLGDMAIASIGATSSLYGLNINFALGLNSGYGIIVAQSFGAKNEEKLRKSIATMITLNLIIATLLTIFSHVFLRSFMRMMNIPESIFDEAYTYISIILGGMLVTICYNMFAGIMRALGNSRTPLYFLILAVILNVCLDILFVMTFNLGVAGAAIATVIAQTLAALLCGIYLLRKYGDILPKKEDFKLEMPLVKEMSSSGFAMAMMLCVVDIGSVIYQSSINELGELLIVSHTAARKIISIFMMPISSIATANSTFVSQNWGAGKKQRIKDGLRKIIAIAVGYGVFAFVMLFFLGGLVVQFITGTNDSEVIKNAVLSVRIHASCFSALGVLLVLRTTLQSMGYKVAPVISSVFELSGKIISGMWLIPSFGYLYVCLTEPVIWNICALFLIIVFLRLKPFENEEKLVEPELEI